MRINRAGLLISCIYAAQGSIRLGSPQAPLLVGLSSNIQDARQVNDPQLPGVWEVLGPFPHGSRETGVDPLSAYGGFEHLAYNELDRYASELADGGWVTWRKVATNSDGVVGPIDYPNVRWDFNIKPFGWTVLHHATYFRGTFQIEVSGTYLVAFDRIVSFKIDNRAYAGNVYEYNHASESAIFLDAGQHTIYVCTFMDVRLFGGSVPPKPSFTGRFKFVDAQGPQRGIVAFPRDTVLPDILEGALVSPFGSVAIMNARADLQSVVGPSGPNAPLTDGPGWIQVEEVNAYANGVAIPTKLLTLLNAIKLAPTQIFPVPFQFTGDLSNFPKQITLEVLLRSIDSNETFGIQVGTFTPDVHAWGEAYKFTHVGYDGSIQYAMAKPPISRCVRSLKVGCPIIVALHGAGVDADSPFWTTAIKRQEYAWVVYPSGRTPWGFDWHGPSHQNLDSSIDTLQQRLPGIPRHLVDDVRPSSDHRLYVGHSNGGQGVWWALTHYPDTALAGIAAASYVKIQQYIPYYMHIGNAYADPLLRAILELSIAENDLDLYVPNAAGIPLLARTGGNDDNVPPLHTRRLVRIFNEWSRNISTSQVSEVPGKGHWFEGVLQDDTVQSFLDSHLHPSANPLLALPPLPEAFTIQTLNPASTGSKGGIRILQLEVPYRLATIRVHRYDNKWILNTTNVRRFGFSRDERQRDIVSWSIDGTDFPTPPIDSGPSYLRISETGKWQLASDLLWISRERHPSTYGPIKLVFSHPFRIVVPSEPTANHTHYRRLAQHIATSWYLHGLGGTQIIRDVDVLDGLAARYNLIILGGPLDNLYTRRREHEGGSRLVKFLPSGGFSIGGANYEGRGMGVMFLAPSPTRTRLGLFVAGIDAEGLQRAVWTIPFRTGLEVPDYMVVGEEYGDPATGWTAGNGSPFGGGGTKGAGGVLAAGYWNNTWEFDTKCGYLK